MFVLHAVNAQAEIFPAERNSNLEAKVTSSKVPLMEMAATTQLDLSDLGVSRVAAYYDEEKERYVLVWSTYAVREDVAHPPPAFVASSLTANPLGPWMIWALNLRPDVAQGVCVCEEQAASAYHLANLQVRVAPGDRGVRRVLCCRHHVWSLVVRFAWLLYGASWWEVAPPNWGHT